jgi:hypothetical protein
MKMPKFKDWEPGQYRIKGDTVIHALLTKFRNDNLTAEQVTERYNIDPIEVTGLPYEDVRYIVLVDPVIGKKGKLLRPRLYCPRVQYMKEAK